MKVIKIIELLNVWIGFFGVLGVLVLVNMTKVVLGGVLTFVGAFFPDQAVNKLRGSGKLIIKGIHITFGGSIRVAVIVSGIVVLTLAALDSHNWTFQKELDQYNKLFSNIASTDAQIDKATDEIQRYGNVPKDCLQTMILLQQCSGISDKDREELRYLLVLKSSYEEAKKRYLVDFVVWIKVSPLIWKIVYYDQCRLSHKIVPSTCSMLKTAIDNAL